MNSVAADAVFLLGLPFGLLGTVAAVRFRQLWSPAGDHPRQVSRAATIVTVAAAAGVAALGGVGTDIAFGLAGLATTEDPGAGIRPDVVRDIWIQAWVPVLIVVTALVLARVLRLYTVTFLLALASPVLPIGLWWIYWVVIYGPGL